MTSGLMAPDAVRLTRHKDGLDECLMTGYTVGLHHLVIPRMDHDWFMKVLQRESFRVEKPVACFGIPFRQAAVGQVTVVTYCNRMVPRFLPTIVMLTHDVAVEASCRVIAQIGGSFRIIGRVGTRTDQYADQT